LKITFLNNFSHLGGKVQKILDLTGRRKQWIAFLRKSRLGLNQEFNKIMGRITAFLRPIVISIKDKTRMDKSWDVIRGCWKN